MMPTVSRAKPSHARRRKEGQYQAREGVEIKEERGGVLLGVTLLLVITCSRSE